MLDTIASAHTAYTEAYIYLDSIVKTKMTVQGYDCLSFLHRKPNTMSLATNMAFCKCGYCGVTHGCCLTRACMQGYSMALNIIGKAIITCMQT